MTGAFLVASGLSPQRLSRSKSRSNNSNSKRNKNKRKKRKWKSLARRSTCATRSIRIAGPWRNSSSNQLLMCKASFLLPSLPSTGRSWTSAGRFTGRIIFTSRPTTLTRAGASTLIDGLRTSSFSWNGCRMPTNPVPVGVEWALHPQARMKRSASSSPMAPLRGCHGFLKCTTFTAAVPSARPISITVGLTWACVRRRTLWTAGR
mmetsp:Transcript_24986/g.68591  ORF Transcript_24986/g.68591 Transcript_24986/m.68591 type:complete len:205 (-) Transcript_24986:2480-3094(-)